MTNEPECVAGGTCAVFVDPAEVDAAGKLTLTAKARGADRVDLRGRALFVLDADAEFVARLPFTEFDGDENRTDEIVVDAPARIGKYSWTALIPAHEAGVESIAPLASGIAFQVVPHRVSVQVWDVPSAIKKGEAFRVKVGAKCSSACPSLAWVFTVRDHEGNSVAQVDAEDRVWPGTTGLHFAEVELFAPDAEGLFKWEVLAKAATAELPHAEGRRTFGLRSVSPPRTLIRVEATDRKSHAPIEGLKVSIHPFAARTGPDGVAEFHASNGKRRLIVSGRGYIPYAAEFTLEEEIRVRVELDPDVGLTHADVWA